jgi:hypothetical protein
MTIIREYVTRIEERWDVDTKSLVRQFGKDPGSVFVDIIRASPAPLRARDIKQPLIDAGIKKDDIDRYWTRVQRVITLHPQIAMASNKYEWLPERRSAQRSLDLLAKGASMGRRQWLMVPWVQNVADAVERAGATDSGWAERQFQQARLVAELAVAVGVLQARGSTIADVAELLAEEARQKRLWQLAEPGDSVAFDPDAHEAETGAPEPGTPVRVVRSGYIWRGAGTPMVAAKAVVTV